MITPKDFIVGCITILAVGILVPLLYLGLKLSLLIAIPLAVIAGALLGVAIFGKVVRYIFTRKKDL